MKMEDETEADDDIQSYSSFCKCKFVHSEKQLNNLRQRCEKKPAISLNDSLNNSMLSSTKPVSKKSKRSNSVEPNNLFKIVLIGASSSGKTSLLLRFIEDTFVDSYLCTIGVDFKIKTVTIDK